jgi:hypothetical protein
VLSVKVKVAQEICLHLVKPFDLLFTFSTHICLFSSGAFLGKHFLTYYRQQYQSCPSVGSSGNPEQVKQMHLWQSSHTTTPPYCWMGLIQAPILTLGRTFCLRRTRWQVGQVVQDRSVDGRVLIGVLHSTQGPACNPLDRRLPSLTRATSTRRLWRLC